MKKMVIQRGSPASGTSRLCRAYENLCIDAGYAMFKMEVARANLKAQLETMKLRRLSKRIVNGECPEYDLDSRFPSANLKFTGINK